jgi:uncharacterized protein YcfL
MKYLLLFPLLILAGCSTTVPVTIKFPEAPQVLLEKCPPLQTIDKQENVSIIDITKNVTANYTTYYECGVKVENWIEWYNDQKKIFDNIGKGKK